MIKPVEASGRRPALPDLVLAGFLVAGLLTPDLDAWRRPFELALLPLCLWSLWRHGLGDDRSKLALVLPLTWIAWLGLSGGWGTASAFEEWDHHSLAALMTGLFFVLSTNYVRTGRIIQLETLATALVLASAVNLLANFALHLSIGDLARARLTGLGIFEHEILGSFVATFVALLALNAAVAPRSPLLRAAMIAYVVLAFAHILLTGSRSGILLYCAVVATYLYLRGVRSVRILALGLAVGLTAILTLIAVLFPEAPQFVRDTVTREVYRLQIWHETISLSGERAFLGYGIGDDTEIAGRFSHPHNMHLSNLFYGGVPALVLGLLTFGATLLFSWRLPETRCRPLALAVVVFLVLSTLPDTSVPISKPGEVWYRFWIPLALVWGLALRSDAA